MKSKSCDCPPTKARNFTFFVVTFLTFFTCIFWASDSNKGTKTTSTVPRWASGLWQLSEDKKVSLKLGSVTCPFEAIYLVSLDVSETYSSLDFDQNLVVDADATDNLDCLVKADKSGQDWKFSYPLIIGDKSQDQLEFRADMQQECEDCKIPKSGGQITGTISRRNDDEIRLTLRGPLPGEFILKLDKK